MQSLPLNAVKSSRENRIVIEGQPPAFMKLADFIDNLKPDDVASFSLTESSVSSSYAGGQALDTVQIMCDESALLSFDVENSTLIVTGALQTALFNLAFILKGLAQDSTDQNDELHQHLEPIQATPHLISSDSYAVILQVRLAS